MCHRATAATLLDSQAGSLSRMYHSLLTNRYLTTRVIPLVAVGAVGLCVALVIIVVSVMTGFLDMVRNSGRTLIGDVVVSYPVSGIPHYDELIQRINALPAASAATPVVDSFGLLRMPYPEGDNKESETVQVWGIEPESFAAVTGYGESLYWRNLNQRQTELLKADLVDRHPETILEMLDTDQRRDVMDDVFGDGKTDWRADVDEAEFTRRVADTLPKQWLQIIGQYFWEPDELRHIFTEAQWQEFLALDQRLVNPNQLLEDGLTLKPSTADNTRPGITLGIHVSVGNIRTEEGEYRVANNWHWWMPRYSVSLTLLPILSGGFVEPETRELQVVNEFKSGVFVIDESRVMIPLHVAQQMLHLDEAQRVDPDDPDTVLGVDPARATLILVRAAEGTTPEQLRDAVKIVYNDFAEQYWDDDRMLVKPPVLQKNGFPGTAVQTWLEQQARFIGPIEKERELMRTLFSIVYLVCAGLVLAIFWAIVYEKTRDIGILRSIGASRLGISWIFLRYGLVVGVFGALLGLLLGWLIVRNINSIHDALGKPPMWLAMSIYVLAFAALIATIVRSLSGRLMPLVLGSLCIITLLGIASLMVFVRFIGGIQVWTPEVYYFTEIPNQVDYNTAVTTMIGAVIFSLIGAFLPAAKAADVDPVKALRYE